MTVLYRPTPQALSALNIEAFRKRYSERLGIDLPDYAALHRQSVHDLSGFWSAVREHLQIIGDGDGPAYVPGADMRAARFFPDLTLNYAENLLERGAPDAEAVVFRSEGGHRERYTRAQLRAAVAARQALLRRCSVGAGDRIAACMPNTAETLIDMLAASASAITWASCSPDFGVQGIIDRFAQIAPKILLITDGYLYAGKQIDILAKITEALPRLPSLRHVWVHAFLRESPDLTALTQAARTAGVEVHLLPPATQPPEQVAAPRYVRVPFRFPLFVMFSSGTTGVPKCIVHSHGGTLLQIMKEHKLHVDLHPGDRMFYFTTCAWMMWNWLVTALACETTLLLYDGSAFHPEPDTLLRYAADERASVLGVSAKYLDTLRQHDLRPSGDLSALRTVLSTGSPLGAACYDYVYSHIKHDVHLTSIAGGTDILSCFMPGIPSEPVIRGRLQPPGLGMAINVYDDQGHPTPYGDKGELVCEQPFPSMPVCFFNDHNDAKYKAAYFERFANVWTHGDFAIRYEDGSLELIGRSDSTLNPGGVRIGTAEIYRVLEQLPTIDEGLCVGQEITDDVRIVLFVVMQPGHALDDDLRGKIKQAIRTQASPRHVPAVIVAVSALPRTRSGKITEQAVREIIHNRPVPNTEALLDASVLNLYRDLPELRL